MTRLNDYERTLTVVQTGPVTWMLVDERGETRGRRVGARGLERLAGTAARWMADYADQEAGARPA